MNINICFFGISRAFDLTEHSITQELLGACYENFNTQIFIHLIKEPKVQSPRTGEAFIPNHDLVFTFAAKNSAVIDTNLNTETIDEVVQKFSCWGDAWQDNFYSLKNLLKQLDSVQRVYRKSLSRPAEITIFSRLDVRYMPGTKALVKAILAKQLYSKSEALYTPNWQMSGGLNDRFAITTGGRASSTFGERLAKANEYCRSYNSPLHGERLLKYATSGDGITVRKIPIKFSRVRGNGVAVAEDFRPEWLRRVLGD